MNLKEKLADAHNNFPIIESHPAMLYAEALNEIIELEEALEECRKYFQSRSRRFGMNEDTLTTLWIGAFRYYCGRETIAVHSFCNDLVNEYENIPEQAKSVIKRDLIRAFDDDDRDRAKNREVKTLGHDMDRAKWLEVLLFFKASA